MARPAVLMLSHRIPYPPDKGDKIRSYQWLQCFSSKYDVSLVAFVDDPRDWAYVQEVRKLCKELLLVPLHPEVAKLRSLWGLFTQEPLTRYFYRDRRVVRWIEKALNRQCYDLVFVYSSAMAQYAQGFAQIGARVIIDFVDVDAEKWQQYAEAKPLPVSLFYRREARTLLHHDIEVANRCERCLFVSEQEAACFSRATGGGPRVECLTNGVDGEYFCPLPGDSDDRTPVGAVFTGAMDYYANVDAVLWFCRSVWPLVTAEIPHAKFHVVGPRPTATVTSLESRSVVVTGRVEDVRPYLRNSAVVAPMRIARGVQNKVLEGMSMARPVVATSAALSGIGAEPFRHLLVADGPSEFASTLVSVLSGEHKGIGTAARHFVREHHDWRAICARLLDLATGVSQ